MHQSRASREEAEERRSNSPPRRWRCPGWCPSRRGGSTRRRTSRSPRPRASPTTAAPSPAAPPPPSSPFPETWSGPAPAASTRSAAFSLAKIKTPARSVDSAEKLLLPAPSSPSFSVLGTRGVHGQEQSIGRLCLWIGWKHEVSLA